MLIEHMHCVTLSSKLKGELLVFLIYILCCQKNSVIMANEVKMEEYVF